MLWHQQSIGSTTHENNPSYIVHNPIGETNGDMQENSSKVMFDFPVESSEKFNSSQNLPMLIDSLKTVKDATGV